MTALPALRPVDLSHPFSMHSPGWVNYPSPKISYFQRHATHGIVSQWLETPLHISTHIDGEMHADVALSPRVAARLFPDSVIQGDANVIVCPDLASGNIGYKLLEHLAGADAIGPILLGIRRPVVVCYQAASMQTLVNLTAIALARRSPAADPVPAQPAAR